MSVIRIRFASVFTSVRGGYNAPFFASVFTDRFYVRRLGLKIYSVSVQCHLYSVRVQCMCTVYSGIGIGPRDAGADEKYEAKMHFPRNKMVNFKIFRLWRKIFLMVTSASGNHFNFYLLKFWRKMNKRMKKEEMWLCSSDFLPI